MPLGFATWIMFAYAAKTLARRRVGAARRAGHENRRIAESCAQLSNRQNRTDRALRAITVLLGATATMIGGILLLGHQALAIELAVRFGYGGPVFAIYGRDDILMEGMSIIMNYLGPKCAMAGIVVVIFVLQRPSEQTVLWSSRLLAVSFAMFALTLVYLPEPTDMAWMLFLRRHDGRVAQAALTIAALGTVTIFRARHFIPRLSTAAKSALVVSAWVFILWLTPRLVPTSLYCFPTARVVFDDSREGRYTFLNHANGLWILGDPIQRSILLFPDARISASLLSSCS